MDGDLFAFLDDVRRRLAVRLDALPVGIGIEDATRLIRRAGTEGLVLMRATGVRGR